MIGGRRVRVTHTGWPNDSSLVLSHISTSERTRSRQCSRLPLPHRKQHTDKPGSLRRKRHFLRNNRRSDESDAGARLSGQADDRCHARFIPTDAQMRVMQDRDRSSPSYSSRPYQDRKSDHRRSWSKTLPYLPDLMSIRVGRCPDFDSGIQWDSRPETPQNRRRCTDRIDRRDCVCGGSGDEYPFASEKATPPIASACGGPSESVLMRVSLSRRVEPGGERGVVLIGNKCHRGREGCVWSLVAVAGARIRAEENDDWKDCVSSPPPEPILASVEEIVCAMIMLPHSACVVAPHCLNRDGVAKYLVTPPTKLISCCKLPLKSR